MDDDDDDLDDRDHAAEAPLDRAFACLVDFIYERFPHSEPQTAAPSAPHCEYENYFSISDPPEPARKFMRLYPRVSEIQNSVSEYAANLSRESRPLFRVLPSRRRSFSIGDDPDFCRQRFLNSDFARICRSKSVSKSRMASVSLVDLERLDCVARMVLAGDSQCFWFLSVLLVQLKEDDYKPSNPCLFDKSISSLSSALATQTNVASCLSEFITAKCRESYLSHSSFTLPESLKSELLVAPGNGSFLFNQPLLSSAIENMKEDSLLSSTSSLASISKAAIKSKSQGGPGKYTSPLDTPRASTSGFRKRSSSPYRRGSKRSRGGRGAAPSSTRGGFLEVGVMPLSNRYRWLSVAPMAHLERRGRGSLGGGGSAGRISHFFPKGSHFIQGAHPFFGLLSQFNPGQSPRAGSGISAAERSHRAGSTSFTRLLQPSFCSNEGVGVVASGNRSITFEPQGVEDTVQDGDYPVHSVVSPQRGLDGLHRSQRCLSSDSNPSRFQEVSEGHGLREGLSVQGPLLRAVHGYAGLHAGHDSGFGNSTQIRLLSSTLSGRLADLGVLPRAGSPVFEDSSSSLQLSGDCRQLREVPLCSDSENLLSGSPFGLYQFQGFPSPETSRQAALNWRRVSILRGAACKILAGVTGSSLFSNPAHSGGTAADVVVPVCSSSLLGSCRSESSSSVVSRNSSRPSLVVKSRTPRTRNLSGTGVSPARLVVRRLGCRQGSSSRRPGRFRPLVPRGDSQLHKSAGASSYVLCSPAFSPSGSQHLCGRVCGQHDCSGQPEE